MGYLLMVDDDEDFARAAAKVLRDAGHEIAIELDPEKAIDAMKQKLPDLVILDVMFPDDSSAGFNLARQMRQDGEGLEKVPVLMLTAINAKSPLGFSANDIDDNWLPVTDFLEKPIDFDVLRNKVSKLLSESGQAGSAS